MSYSQQKSDVNLETGISPLLHKEIALTSQLGGVRLRVRLHLSHCVAILFGFANSVLATQMQAACPRYSLQAAHPPPCTGIPPAAAAYALDENGRLAGGFTSFCFNGGGAFLWTNGYYVTPLPVGSGVVGSACFGLNSIGQSVGWKEGATGHKGFLNQNGITVDLALQGATLSEAFAINQLGQACGQSDSAMTPHPRAFLWQNGIAIDLGTPGPSSEAYAINDTTQVTGWLGVAPNPPFFGHAFLWQDGVSTDLGVPAGSTNSEGKAINSLGDICGVHTVLNAGGNPPYFRRAFLWSKGVFTDLGLLPGGFEAYAYGINDQKQIVGYCIGQSFVSGFVWENGVMYSLDDVSPGHVAMAYAINNKGQIAGQGYIGTKDEVAVLLAPIPPVIGDYNCDQIVNIDDLLGVINHWGQTGPPAPGNNPADLNGDGIVNMSDLMLVITHWS